MKNVTMTRSYGDTLLRTDSKRYRGTGVKNRNKISLTVPDGEANLYKRIGGSFKVEDLLKSTDVFTTFTVAKVDAANVPDDANKVKSQNNQTQLTVEKIDDNTYNLKADFSKLQAFTSLDERVSGLGDKKWIAVLIHTNATHTIDIVYNGENLTEEDAAETVLVGGGEGDVVAWTYAGRGTAVFTLEYKGKSCVITFNVINTAEA